MKRRLWTAVTVFGLVLLVAAAGLTIGNVHADRQAARSRDSLLQEISAAMPQSDGEPETEDAAEDPLQFDVPAVSIDGQSVMGAVFFPTLSLELPVLAEYDLPSLRIAPAVFSGTPEGEDLVICGHNYRSHFGPLNQLARGDEVFLKTMDGAVYRYEVSATEIVSPLAVEDVVGGAWDLTLFTCTMGGQNRFVVRCDLA